MAKQIRYSDEFKSKAVALYLQGELSCNQIAQRIHVHPNTLSAWIKKYKDSPLPSVSQQSKCKAVKNQPPANPSADKILLVLSELEEQVKALKGLISNYK